MIEKTKVIAALVFFTISIGAVPISYALTGEQIVERMEQNQVHDTAESSGSMSITDRFGTRTKTYKASSMGEDKMLLEFTNPEEAGQKILRTDDEIYLYFPDAEEIIHLQGSALKDSVMGSDFSYEDLTGGKALLDDYTVRVDGEEIIDGFKCYRLELKARKRDVVYPAQTVWVDSEVFVYRKVILYSLKGKALKEMNVKEFLEIKGKTVPAHMEMRDLMKKNSKTVFKTESLEIDIPIDERLFSLEELSW
jgi:outer membrane lipoprotein-sorting protein